MNTYPSEPSAATDQYSWYQWSDLKQVIYLETKGIRYDVYGSHDNKFHCWVSGIHYRSPDLSNDYWSEKCLDHVHVIHKP
jgi:hypothetical protein